MFTNLNLTDMEVCYKVFRREILQGMTLRSNRFGFEPEVTAKVSRRKPTCRIYEVPVSYAGRTYAEGKKSASATPSQPWPALCGIDFLIEREQSGSVACPHF
jgi:hypothetical protein